MGTMIVTMFLELGFDMDKDWATLRPRRARVNEEPKVKV